MTQRDRLYSLIAAAVLVCGGMAIADQAGTADPAPEHAQAVALQAGDGLQVGDRLDPAELHPVTRPGLYGMSQSPDGSAYGVVDGRLIRFDPESLTVKSIIRQVERILD